MPTYPRWKGQPLIPPSSDYVYGAISSTDAYMTVYPPYDNGIFLPEPAEVPRCQYCGRMSLEAGRETCKGCGAPL